jgi:hypothetical protein
MGWYRTGVPKGGMELEGHEGRASNVPPRWGGNSNGCHSGRANNGPPRWGGGANGLIYLLEVMEACDHYGSDTEMQRGRAQLPPIPELAE